MNPLLRFLRFNLVGAVGAALQLASLALFNRFLRGHLLVASSTAVELAILHNFAWHLRCTWPDRRDLSARTQLLRFHLSNGLVSLTGNLMLMPVFVHSAHLAPVPANALAILCCGLANFLLAHHWAFRSQPPSTLRPPSICTVLLCAALPFISAPSAGAQAPGPTSPSSSAATLPQAPMPHPYQPSPSASYLANVGLFCGTGASSSSVTTKPTFGCGAGMTLLPLPIFFEAGIMAPQANRSYLSGYISLDGYIPLAPHTAVYLPLALVGYSRLFETGHALDYGLALALPRPGHSANSTDSMRIELRDYYTFANPTQHNIMLRVGLLSIATD